MTKNPEEMGAFQLRAYCRTQGIEAPKTASCPEMLDMLGIVKKGKRSWKPAKVLDVHISDEMRKKVRPRWRDKDAQNIQRAQAEGWEFFDPSKGLSAEHDHSSTSVPEYRELILMALPEEIGEARDEHFQEKTRQQTRGLKNRLQKNLDKTAQEEGGYRTSATGRVVID